MQQFAKVDPVYVVPLAVEVITGEVSQGQGENEEPAIQLPDAWIAYAETLAGAKYVCPMCAQLLLARSASWSYDAGAVKVNGSLLMGRAGKVFNFALETSAARWVTLNSDRLNFEARYIAAVIDGTRRASWFDSRKAVLTRYANQVNLRAGEFLTIDAEKAAALKSEADFARLKWDGLI